MTRKLFTLALLLAVAIIARAQDIITTVSDVNIEATITSIDVNVIRYRPAGQTDTATLEIDKAEVASIRFANGRTVTYAQAESRDEAAVAQAQAAPEPVTAASTENNSATEATIASINVDVIHYRQVGQIDTTTVEPPARAVEHPSINAYPLPSVEELQWDYQRALSLRNTGTGLMTSGSLLMLLGVASPFLFLYDTAAFAIAVVLGWGIATPIGTGLLIAGIPCYIIGNNRMAQAAFAIRQYSSNVQLYNSGNINLSLGLAPGTVGLALNF